MDEDGFWPPPPPPASLRCLGRFPFLAAFCETDSGEVWEFRFWDAVAMGLGLELPLARATV